MHRRAASAPAWAYAPTTPADPLPPPSWPFLRRAPSWQRLRRFPLAPRPPAASATFLLLESLADEQRVAFRPLPAPARFWQAAGVGGGLAARRGRAELRVDMGEIRGDCSCADCMPWLHHTSSSSSDSPLEPLGALTAAFVDEDPPIHNSFASCGYIPPVWSLEPGRHFMTIYHDARHDFTWHVLDVAHELGHVFGMVHEHQRLDRDQHVHYDCSKLAGYAAAKQDLAKLDDPDKPSMDDVCASNWLGGHLLGFWAPADYSTDMGDTAGVKNPQDSSTEYDTKSIMTYPSWAHAATPDGDVTQVPLVQWKGTAPPPGTMPNGDNAELVADVSEISVLDREFIKRTYPW